MSPLVLFLLTMIPGTILLGFYDVHTKKLLQKGIGEQTLVGVGFSGAGLIFLVALFFFGIPDTAPGFWSTFFFASILTVLGQFAWYRAFNYGTVSFIAPLRVLTPLIIIFTGSLFLGEVPSQNGLVGIALTVSGLLLLLGAQGGSFFASLKESLQSSGFLWGMLAVLAFSISFPLDKKAILASSTLFYSTCLYGVTGITSLLIAFLLNREKTREGLSTLWQNRRVVLVWILFLVTGGFLVNHALNFTLAVYAASVKRLQALWSVLLSGAFLKEGHTLRKSLATLIMLIGVIMTIVFG
ncbi:MAG: DMT family transporter [bacterium]|nr:DMT family transporter [bacterium]